MTNSLKNDALLMEIFEEANKLTKMGYGKVRFVCDDALLMAKNEQDEEKRKERKRKNGR